MRHPKIEMVVVALLGVAGCGVATIGPGPALQGSGVTKREAREVPAFRGVEVTSAFEATVSVGPEPSVTLEADDNLLPLIRTVVKDGRLVVDYAPGRSIRTVRPQKVAIVARSVDFLKAEGASKITAEVGESAGLEVEASGASTVSVAGLASDNVAARASGASRIVLKGRSKALTLDLGGASSIAAADVAFERAKVAVDGASHGEIQVTGSIEGEVSGASRLAVAGHPGKQEVRTSDVSTVSY